MNRFTSLRLGGGLLLAACALPTLAAGAFYGYAYELASGKYLYTEVHAPVVEGGREIGGTIRYFSPDGKPIGSKTLDYRADPYVPVYRLELPGEGYVEGITAAKPAIEMMKIGGPGKPEKRKTLVRDGGALFAADSGFHHAVQDNLPKLVKGEAVDFRFAVAGRLDSYRFKIKKVGETTFDGKPAVKLLVQADSLLRYVAPDLNLVYDPATKQLLEYQGVSNIHDPVSGKAYNARIVYPATPPADAPRNLPPLP